jgi:uncharacterized membrane protein
MNGKPSENSVQDRYRVLVGNGGSTGRLETFSDGVFAIAITLLILDIGVPDVPRAQLAEALAELAPKYFAYVLSFAVIAISWIGHHRRFELIGGRSQGFVRVNLLLLLLIAFVPFPTAVLSEYGSQTEAVVLYAATVSAISGVNGLLWVVARRAGILVPEVDRGVYRYVRRNILVTCVVFAVSIGIALLGQPLLAMYSWILNWPASVIAERSTRLRSGDLEPANAVPRIRAPGRSPEGP